MKKILIIFGIIVVLALIVVALSSRPDVQKSFNQGKEDAQKQLQNK